MTDGVPYWRPPSWLDPNAIQLCGALEEVDLGWAVVGDVGVGGAFGSLVFSLPR